MPDEALKAKARAVRDARAIPTFEQFCEDMNCTVGERNELAWHLASFRFRRTIEALTAPLAALSMLRRPTPGDTGGGECE